MKDPSPQSLKPTFVSLVPNLLGGEGHIIDYHQAVSKAVNLLGWPHRVAVVPDERVTQLPEGWDSSLAGGNLEAEGNVLQKIIRIYRVVQLGQSIARYLRDRIIPQSEHTIIFLERFIHLQLLALALSLLLIPRDNVSVWVLYRRDTHNAKTRLLYKVLNQAIASLLPPHQFQLLTDSELLGQSLSDYFQEPVTVLPIPHTEVLYSTFDSHQQNPKILCWWPGFPRKEKGWDIIKSLVNTDCEEATKLCIIAAKSSDLIPSSKGAEVQLIENNLTRKDYLKQLHDCDLILLPYHSEAYRERTSGIFTECIIAGKIPLVTPYTWMAEELARHNLGELVLDWQNPEQTIRATIAIKNNEETRLKLEKMQQKYSQFHNIKSYAKTLDKLFVR